MTFYKANYNQILYFTYTQMLHQGNDVCCVCLTAVGKDVLHKAH